MFNDGLGWVQTREDIFYGISSTRKAQTFYKCIILLQLFRTEDQEDIMNELFYCKYATLKTNRVYELTISQKLCNTKSQKIL